MNFLTKNSFLNNLEFTKSENHYLIKFISPLYGSSKSFAVKDLLDKNEQIVLLHSDIKLVNETKVELNVIGLANSLIVIDDFNLESIQEKITEISKRKKFILVTTYQILNLKLPEKEKINKIALTELDLNYVACIKSCCVYDSIPLLHFFYPLLSIPYEKWLHLLYK